MTHPDLHTAERELCRWLILVALDAAEEIGVTESMLQSALREALPFLPPPTLRHEVRYLAGLHYIQLHVAEGRPWRASITPAGTDIVEYRAECPASIARPAKGYGI